MFLLYKHYACILHITTTISPINLEYFIIHFREAFAKVFDDIDTNKDGTLSRDEIRVVCQRSGYSDAEIDEMIKACDTDGDGKLSKKEFMALV